MRVLVAVLSLFAALPALAVEPSEMLKDPALEARAREVSAGLRCLVCQNQSIDDSDANLARDLRLLVRERITAGDSNQQVVDYVVSRYGDFVLLKPRLTGTTAALWLGPGLIVIFGLIAVVVFFRRNRAATGASTPAPPPPLSDEEKRRLAELMEDDPK